MDGAVLKKRQDTQTQKSDPLRGMLLLACWETLSGKDNVSGHLLVGFSYRASPRFGHVNIDERSDKETMYLQTQQQQQQRALHGVLRNNALWWCLITAKRQMCSSAVVIFLRFLFSALSALFTVPSFYSRMDEKFNFTSGEGG